jgi:hypothetical protein
VLPNHQRLPHDGERTVEVAFDQVGIHAHDTQPAVGERRIANAVYVPAVLVDWTVDLDDQPARRSEKVHDESAKYHLAAKAHAESVTP